MESMSKPETYSGNGKRTNSTIRTMYQRSKQRKGVHVKNLKSIEAIIGASISVLVITYFIFEISISSKSLQNL